MFRLTVEELLNIELLITRTPRGQSEHYGWGDLNMTKQTALRVVVEYCNVV